MILKNQIEVLQEDIKRTLTGVTIDFGSNNNNNNDIALNKIK